MSHHFKPHKRVRAFNRYRETCGDREIIYGMWVQAPHSSLFSGRIEDVTSTISINMLFPHENGDFTMQILDLILNLSGIRLKNPRTIQHISSKRCESFQYTHHEYLRYTQPRRTI